MLSFASSFVVYFVLCLIWPTKNQKLVKEMGFGWEEVSYKEIIARDGTVITDELEGYPDRRMEVVGGEKWAGAFVGEADSPTR